MKKILFIFEHGMATIELLKKRFLNSEPFGFSTSFLPVRKVRKKDIVQSDLIIFVRPKDMLSLKIMKNAKKSGREVAFFADDDLLHLPEDSQMSRSRLSNCIKMIEEADILYISNINIYKSFRQYLKTDRVFLIEYIINENEVIRKSINDLQDSGKTKLVYAGGSGHIIDFEKFIKPIWEKLVDEFNDSVSLTLVGMRPRQSEDVLLPGVSFVDPMPLQQYRDFMEQSHFSVGIAPMETNDFTKCKYYNKFIEYSISGIPGIYTNCEPYTFIAKDGENCVLAEPTPESWLNAIKFAIRNPEEMYHYLENAQSLIMENGKKETVLSRFANFSFMNDKSEYHDVKDFSVFKVFYLLARISGLGISALKHLKSDGLRSVLNRVKAFSMGI